MGLKVGPWSHRSVGGVKGRLVRSKVGGWGQESVRWVKGWCMGLKVIPMLFINPRRA